MSRHPSQPERFLPLLPEMIFNQIEARGYQASKLLHGGFTNFSPTLKMLI